MDRGREALAPHSRLTKGQRQRVAAEHYVYALTDYREADYGVLP